MLISNLRIVNFKNLNARGPRSIYNKNMLTGRTFTFHETHKARGPHLPIPGQNTDSALSINK